MPVRPHTSAAGPAQPETAKTQGFTNSQEETCPVLLPKGNSLDGLHAPPPPRQRKEGRGGCRSSLPGGQCMRDAITWAFAQSKALEEAG